MSDKDYLDWYKNDLDLEAKINKRIEALEKRLETRIDTQHDSDMRSLDIIGINELDIRHIKSVLKELSAKDDPKHYEGDEKKDGV